MAGRVDPPHDQVSLSPAERRAVAGLEVALDDPVTGGLMPVYGRVGLRYRVLALCVRCVPFAPWLFPLGAVLMIVALSFSVPLSLGGALVASLGLTALFKRVALWRPVAGLRRRWRA